MNLPSTFTYNGMLKTNEIAGEGNSFQTEFRQYDSRLGKWLSLDPLMEQFPWMSPFVGFDNNPILYVDPYGLESTNPDGDNPGILGSERPPCDGMDGYAAEELNQNSQENENSASNDKPEYPTLRKLMYFSYDTQNRKWNDYALKNSNDYSKLNKLMPIISNYGVTISRRLRQSENYITNPSYKDITTVQNTVVDGVNQGLIGLNMQFRTKNGNYLDIFIPIFEVFGNFDLGPGPITSIRRINYNDISNTFANCYASCLGLIGIIGYEQFEYILQNEFTEISAKNIKPGDLLYLKETHAMTYMGLKDGKQIFKSNFNGQPEITGTLEEISLSQNIGEFIDPDNKTYGVLNEKAIKVYRRK